MTELGTNTSTSATGTRPIPNTRYVAVAWRMLCSAERTVWTGLALAVGLYLWQSGLWRFVCDDAAITFRYAANWVNTGAPVYHIGGDQPVEGYTSPLWMAWCAMGLALGADVVGWSLASSRVLGLMCLIAVTLLSTRLRGDASNRMHWADTLPALLLAAWPEFSVWSSGGLETMAGAFILVLGMLMVVDQRWLWAGFFAGLAGLTRLDSLLVFGVFASTWAVLQIADLDRKRVAKGFALAVVMLAAHFLWRQSYYGTWLPHTWAVKQHGFTLRDTYGLAYVFSWGANVGIWLLVLLAPLFRRRHVILVLPIFSELVYSWSVGGDFMAYSRLLLPATILWACWLGWFAYEAEMWIQTKSRKSLTSKWPVIALGAVGLVATSLIVTSQRQENDDEGKWVEERYEGVRAMDNFARVRLAVGDVMRQELPPNTRLTVGAAGAMPFTSKLTVLDTYGLVNPAVVLAATAYTGKGARPGHQLMAPWSVIGAFQPDLLCHLGYHGPKVPPLSLARERIGKRGFQWACFAHGKLENSRGENVIESGHYCCLRPSGHVVGSFGRERANHE